MPDIEAVSARSDTETYQGPVTVLYFVLFVNLLKPSGKCCKIKKIYLFAADFI